MRLLFLCAEPPWPAHGGARMRALHLLRGLAAEHEVHLVCTATARETVDLTLEMAAVCASVRTVAPPAPRGIGRRLGTLVTTPEPDLALRYRDPRFVALLAATLAGGTFDGVHITGLEMVAPLLAALGAQPGSPRPLLVLDAQNAEHQLQARAGAAARGPAILSKGLFSRVQAWKLRRYEGGLDRRLDGLIAVSAGDLDALRGAGLRAPAAVVPNGVDAARYAPGDPPPPGLPLRLLFTGTMDYRPNEDAMTWFVGSVLPGIRAAHPEVILEIAGRRPTATVRALAGAGVQVTGEVDDDLPLFRAASVFVLPMRFGGGSRLKLLQALACGVPVVTTPEGAEGVAVVDGRDVLVATTAAGFAAAVVALAREPAKAAALAAGGRSVALRYDWSGLVPGLLDFYQRLERDRGRAW